MALASEDSLLHVRATCRAFAREAVSGVREQSEVEATPDPQLGKKNGGVTE
jgi:hypothetical protein